LGPLTIWCVPESLVEHVPEVHLGVSERWIMQSPEKKVGT